jgi:amino acid transporter
VPTDLSTSFVQFLQNDVAASGFGLTPAFSLVATLGIVPIAWTSLQWATYSVEQNTEIASADRFWKQVFMLLVSAVVVGLLLLLIAHVEQGTLSPKFVLAASGAYWAQKGSPETVAFVKGVLQPFPNILAIAGSGSIWLSLIIALGFLANAFQITCNCFIGVTRLLVPMATDGLLPKKLRLEEVDPKRHSPARAHWFYLICSVPWIVAYSFIPTWPNYTLGVTFACGYVFVLSAFAATKIPSKMRAEWRTSDISHFPAWLFRGMGWAGFIVGGTMVIAYLLVPQLGLTGTLPYVVVFSIILVAYGLYVYARSRSPLLDKVFEQPPDEFERFYRED